MAKSTRPRRYPRRNDRQIAVRIANELYKALEAEADETCLNLSEVIRSVLIAHATKRITAMARAAG